jgi:hypothetical protein
MEADAKTAHPEPMTMLLETPARSGSRASRSERVRICFAARATQAPGIAASTNTAFVCGLTFEVTPPAQAGGVRLVRDDAPCAADQPYAACRSGSALTEGLGLTERPFRGKAARPAQPRCIGASPCCATCVDSPRTFQGPFSSC